MPSLPISMQKRVGERIKAGWRLLARPFLPILPAALTNRLPFLGRVCIDVPGNVRLCMHTYGPHGKDRIAIKLARRGFDGYEGETTRLFLALVQDANTVIDIGANTGLFALLAALARPTANVWAFEPVPFVFDMLQKNIALNNLANLEAVAMAASDSVGETTFYITRTNVGIPTDSSSCKGFRDQVEEFRLPTMTLDEFIAGRRIRRLDVLKIDAEAAESKVLRGAVDTIRRDRPYVIGEVLEDVDHRYVEDTLISMGYRFYHITRNQLARRDRLHGSLHVEQRNYLFAPAEAEPALANKCASANIAIG